MAKKWAEVTSNPEYQKLSPEDKEGARQQYFQEVIVPQIDPGAVDEARAQFDAETKLAPATTAKEERKSTRAFGIEPGAPLYKRGSFTEGAKNVVGALLEPTLSMATGAISGVAGGAAGAARTGYELMRGRGLDEATARGTETLESIQRAGTYEPRTAAAQSIQRGLGGALDAVNRGIGEVGAAAGRPFGPAGEAAGRTLGEHAVDIAGAYYGAKGLAQAMGTARATPAAPLEQPKEAIREAQQAGFKALPSAGRGGSVNVVLESLADTDRTKAHLIKENIKRASELVRGEVGIPVKGRLDEAVIKRLRDQSSDKYDALKSIPDRIANDATYVQEIRDLDSAFRSVKEHTPSLYTQSGLERVRGALAQSQSPATGGMWTPEAVVDISRSLRSSATKTLKSTSATAEQIDAAFAMKKGADALEGLLERHLDKAGNTAALDEFRKARTTLAKLHTIEENTNLVTGEVNPQGLRRAMERGEPLTGKLRTVARAAAAMPDVVRSAEGLSGKEAAHWSDIGLGGAVAGSIVTGNLPAAATFAGAAAARPVIRKGLASDWYQRHMAAPVAERSAPRIPMGAAAVGGAAAAKTPEYRLEEAWQ